MPNALANTLSYLGHEILPDGAEGCFPTQLHSNQVLSSGKSLVHGPVNCDIARAVADYPPNDIQRLNSVRHSR